MAATSAPAITPDQRGRLDKAWADLVGSETYPSTARLREAARVNQGAADAYRKRREAQRLADELALPSPAVEVAARLLAAVWPEALEVARAAVAGQVEALDARAEQLADERDFARAEAVAAVLCATPPTRPRPRPTRRG